MADSLSKIYVHLIFSTKGRIPSIRKALFAELWAYAAGILKRHRCLPLAIGGTANHIHALFILDRTVTVSDIAHAVKAGTSKWYGEQTLNPFEWQTGYAAFSVSPSKVEAVRRYINHQEEHHRRHAFEEELREFFDKHDMTYDERFIWG